MASPVKFADGFTEASNTTLASHTPDYLGDSWTQIINYATTLQIISVKDWVIGLTFFDPAGAFYTADLSAGYPDDHWCEVIAVEVQAGDNSSSIAVRCEDSTHMYLLRWNTTVSQIYKNTGSGWSTVGSSGGGIASRQWVALEASGTSIKAYVDQVLHISTTDSDLDEGGVGMGMGKNAVSGDGVDKQKLDWFRAGEDGYLDSFAFVDNFTETSDTLLDSHTPDVGYDWTLNYGINSGRLEARSLDHCAPQNNSNAGCVYLAHPTDGSLESANYRVGWRVGNASWSVAPFWYLVARYQNSANFYALEYASGFTALYKKVGGSWTYLNPVGTLLLVQSGDYLEFEIEGPYLRLMVNGTIKAEIQDTDLTGAGGAGIGAGALRISTADLDEDNYVDNFRIVYLPETELSGSIDAQSTVSGNIEATVPLSGSIDAQSGLSGDLQATVPLSGSIDAQSGMLANLSALLPISGAIDAQSNIGGDVVSAVPLSGSIDAQSGLSGGLQVDTALSGVIAAQSHIVGDLKPSVPLSGTIAAQSGVAGDLKSTVPIAGSVDASSSISGVIVSTVPLQGSIDAQSGLAGDLVADVPLAGSVDAQSWMLGQLGAEVPISGQIDAQSNLSGDIQTSVQLSGVIAAQSVITGEVDVSGGLAGLIEAHSSISGLLRVVGEAKGWKGRVIAEGYGGSVEALPGANAQVIIPDGARGKIMER